MPPVGLKRVRLKPLMSFTSDGKGKTKVDLIAGEYETVMYKVRDLEDGSFFDQSGSGACANSASETMDAKSKLVSPDPGAEERKAAMKKILTPVHEQTTERSGNKHDSGRN